MYAYIERCIQIKITRKDTDHIDSLRAILPSRTYYNSAKYKSTKCSTKDNRKLPLSGAVTDSIFEISAIHFDSSQLSEFENLFAV